MEKVIISFITYNCLKYTKLCLNNIKCDYPYEVLVVDNGSIDGTVQWLKEQDVTLIENGQNLGYSYAHNTIFDYAWKDDDDALLVLLSNDMLPLPNAINDLLVMSDISKKSIISGDTIATPIYCTRFPEDRRFFLGGNNIGDGAKGYTTWSAGTYYNLIEETADEFVATMLSKIIPTLPIPELVETASFFPPGHRVYRKAYFDAIGYLDVNYYPVYSADLDYSMRASLTGQKVYVVPSSLCIEFWSRCLYENVAPTRDIRRDDYYREKWGQKAVGFWGPNYEGWSIPFNGDVPDEYVGYDSSQVKITSREGELDRIKFLMGSNYKGGVDPTISKSMDLKHG